MLMIELISRISQVDERNPAAHSHLIDQLPISSKSQGTLLARLQHKSIARRHCRRHLPSREHMRAVPSTNTGADTYTQIDSVSIKSIFIQVVDHRLNKVTYPMVHTAQSYTSHPHQAGTIRPRLCQRTQHSTATSPLVRGSCVSLE
jgi:hypothetical protein